jgi:predicted ester cyclase
VTQEAGTLSPDATRVVRELVDAYNRADWDTVRNAMHADFAHHNGDDTMTRDQFLRGAAWLRAGFPDFGLDIADLVADGDRVAVRFVARGTHAGSLFGETASGQRVAFAIAWMCRVADGVLVEDWETMDELDLRRRIGAMPVAE